jgi:cyanophycin synthetase
MVSRGTVRLIEVRVLDGPNLYFTRPAVKLTVGVAGWLAAPEDRVSAAAGRIGLPGETTAGSRARPGRPGSEARRRFVGRVAVHVTRSLARATGTNLAVRARLGPEPDQIVIAYPWRRRDAAEALGREAATLLGKSIRSRGSFPRVVAEAARRLEAVDPGPTPAVPIPSIPVVAVTGTNGKTTTVRLLAHLVRTAGLAVAYSSTDGVYLNDRLVEKGDFSGFGGAGRALAQPDVDVAVLETARGGILLRGIGTAHNDVAVVTNISADHLDLHGIRTLDQLAEVKSSITRITKPDGWDVLNADDPRVLAMRRSIRGRPWLFSLDPDHPAIRAALSERGRATSVIDGAIAVMAPGVDPHPLVPLADVPLTLAGISSPNIQNAMAAASAALGVGLSERAVVRGLKTFVLDEETNPGRANLYELDGRIVVVDYAHNEAGIRGMVEICRGLRSRGGDVWLAFCSAGDRTNEIIHTVAYTAARGADHVAVAELSGYLRGRDRQDLIERLKAGAIDGGAGEVPVFPDELHALDWMYARSKPLDVIGVTALGQRPEIFAWMHDRGAARVGPKRVRELVRKARRGRSTARPGR